MGLVLTKTDDPRDKLGKATRDELWDYAKRAGVMPEMLSQLSLVGWSYDKGWQARYPGFVATQATVTKDDMEHYLRGRGFIDPQVAIRVMGAPVGYLDGAKPQAPAHAAPVEPVQVPAELAAMSIGELRKACRDKGIKLARTDNMVSMRQKLAAA